MQNDSSSTGGELVDFARHSFEDLELAPLRIFSNQIAMLDADSDYRGPAELENGLAYIYLTQGAAVETSQAGNAVNVPDRFHQHILLICESAASC